MKIVFLNIYQNLVERGAETFVRELSDRLSKKHEVFVLYGNKIPPPRWSIFWRFFIDPQGVVIFWWTLKKLAFLLKEKPDFVIPLNGGWQPALVRLITWFYGGKMLISGQSGKGWDDRNNLWCFPDVFISLSKLLLKWAKKVNPLVRVEYIPNGADINNFKPQGKKEILKLEKPIVLTVGALTGEKRTELVISAIAKIRQGSLVIVGDGPLRNNLERLGKELLGNRILFLGAVPFNKLPEIYRAVDLFTLPSPWYRSFEIVFVEAMATNLPVVANDDPIRREIVSDAGLFVDPTSINEYANVLEKALNMKWHDKPRKQAEKFSWDGIAKEYEELLKKI